VLFKKTLAGLKEVALLMKARHCHQDHRNCGLHKISVELGPEQAPEGLYPNQTGRAELIIWREYQKKRSSGGVSTEGPA